MSNHIDYRRAQAPVPRLSVFKKDITRYSEEVLSW